MDSDESSDTSTPESNKKDSTDSKFRASQSNSPGMSLQTPIQPYYLMYFRPKVQHKMHHVPERTFSASIQPGLFSVIDNFISE